MKFEFPQIIVDLIVNLYFDYDVAANTYPEMISVTTLIDAPYVAQMRKLHEQDLKDKLNNDYDFRLQFARKNWWLILGKAVHSVMEGLPEDRYMKEIRINKEFGDCIVSGKFDVYDKALFELSDYKVTSKFTTSNEIRLRDYFYQLNILKYLLNTVNMTNGEEKYRIDKMNLILFLRDLNPSDMFSNQFPDDNVVSTEVSFIPENDLVKYINDRIAIHLSEYQKDVNNNGCSEKERWYTPETYAVIRKGGKVATKLCEQKGVALRMRDSLNASIIEKNNKKKTGKPEELYQVEYRPACNKRCQDYCDYNIFCPFRKKTLQDIHSRKHIIEE